MARAFLYLRHGYVPKVPTSSLGPIYCRPSVLLPSRKQARKDSICCVQCENWTLTFTELPSGVKQISYLFALVHLRKGFQRPSKPWVGGWSRPSHWPTSHLASHHRWESERTRPGVWRPPRPYQWVWPFRMFVLRQAGPLCTLSSGSTVWTWHLPQGPKFSRRDVLTRHTSDRDLLVWRSGYSHSQSVWRSSSSWRGTSRGYVCNHGSPKGTRCCISLPYSLHPCRRSLPQKLTCVLAGCAFMLPGSSRHPVCDVSLLYWIDFTHASVWCLAGGVPKAFDAASRSLTYVTSRCSPLHLESSLHFVTETCLWIA